MKLTKQQRQELHDKYDGQCAYCGCELKKGWHADHIEPVVKLGGVMDYPERDNLENMNPSCPSCNIQKHSYSLENFRLNIENHINALNLYNTTYKVAKRFGLINETGRKVTFYFEWYNLKIQWLENKLDRGFVAEVGGCRLTIKELENGWWYWAVFKGQDAFSVNRQFRAYNREDAENKCFELLKQIGELE